jgi:hypothetical protein
VRDADLGYPVAPYDAGVSLFRVTFFIAVKAGEADSDVSRDMPAVSTKHYGSWSVVVDAEMLKVHTALGTDQTCASPEVMFWRLHSAAQMVYHGLLDQIGAMTRPAALANTQAR